MSGGEIDCELGDVLLVDGLVVEAGQERLKQTLVLHLALETDEGLGALGNLECGELVAVLHALQPFHHVPLGWTSLAASAAGGPH